MTIHNNPIDFKSKHLTNDHTSKKLNRLGLTQTNKTNKTKHTNRADVYKKTIDIFNFLQVLLYDLPKLKVDSDIQR